MNGDLNDEEEEDEDDGMCGMDQEVSFCTPLSQFVIITLYLLQPVTTDLCLSYIH